MPEGWEWDAGSLGSINCLDYPELTAAENKKYREELRERVSRKIKLGFPLPLPPESKME